MQKHKISVINYFLKVYEINVNSHFASELNNFITALK